MVTLCCPIKIRHLKIKIDWGEKYYLQCRKWDLTLWLQNDSFLSICFFKTFFVWWLAQPNFLCTFRSIFFYNPICLFCNISGIFSRVLKLLWRHCDGKTFFLRDPKKQFVFNFFFLFCQHIKMHNKRNKSIGERPVLTIPIFIKIGVVGRATIFSLFSLLARKYVKWKKRVGSFRTTSLWCFFKTTT